MDILKFTLLIVTVLWTKMPWWVAERLPNAVCTVGSPHRIDPFVSYLEH